MKAIVFILFLVALSIPVYSWRTQTSLTDSPAELVKWSKEKIGWGDEGEDDTSETNPYVDARRQQIDRSITMLNRMQTPDGRFYRVSGPEEKNMLAGLLVPFRSGSDKVKISSELSAKSQGKRFPIFFDIVISIKEKPLAETGLMTVEATADIIGSYTREDKYPLPSEVPVRYLIGDSEANPTLPMSKYSSIEHFIGAIPGGANPDGSINGNVRFAVHEQILKDTGLDAVPGVLTVIEQWSYKGGTEEHVQDIRFLEYESRETFSVRWKDSLKERTAFARRAGLQPKRLEDAVAAFLKEKQNAKVERIMVIYNSAKDTLAVTSDNRRTDPELIREEDIGIEYRAYFKDRGISMPDFVKKIKDDMGAYVDAGNGRLYGKLPAVFVRKVRYPKTGGSDPVITYYPVRDYFPGNGTYLNEYADVLIFIENVMDRGVIEQVSHYFMGCTQSGADIEQLFQSYARSTSSPYPCHAIYNHATGRVERFVPATTGEERSSSDRGQSLTQKPPTYEVNNLRQIDQVRNEIEKRFGKDAGEQIASRKAWERKLKEMIKSGDLPDVRLDNGVLTGGHVIFSISEDSEGKIVVDHFFGLD